MQYSASAFLNVLCHMTFKPCITRILSSTTNLFVLGFNNLYWFSLSISLGERPIHFCPQMFWCRYCFCVFSTDLILNVKIWTFRTRIIPGNPGQYHDCWCPGILHHQIISIHIFYYFKVVAYFSFLYQGIYSNTDTFIFLGKDSHFWGITFYQ